MFLGVALVCAWAYLLVEDTIGANKLKIKLFNREGLSKTCGLLQVKTTFAATPPD